MAVHAKHAEDSVLIQKTKTILDKLTPQVVASEFPRILERIQAKRELIQILGEMDPNLFVELRSDKDMAELEDGSRDYLQDETELRAGFCMDVVDGRVVSATTAPFLVVNLRVDSAQIRHHADRVNEPDQLVQDLGAHGLQLKIRGQSRHRAGVVFF